jgi:hypothetical protein
MRLEDLQELLRRVPFRPFRVILSNNLVHEIRHRDFASVTRSLLKIGFPSAEDVDPEQEEVIGVALIHIVQYEFLPRAQAQQAPSGE